MIKINTPQLTYDSN